MNWDSMAAAGGIISNVSEMAKWIRLQLGRGALDGKRIFSEAAQEVMWMPHTPRSVSAETRPRFPSTHFSSYGLGWNLWDYRGRRIIMDNRGKTMELKLDVPNEDFWFWEPEFKKK